MKLRHQGNYYIDFKIKQTDLHIFTEQRLILNGPKELRRTLNLVLLDSDYS